MRRPILVALILALPGLAATAAAKGYTAQRFDVTIRTLDDGSIQVTETVRMTFDGGPFTFVSREIPLRRTDGIEILGASMDGQVMRRGGDPGQFDVRTRESRVAVRWHFVATSDAAHDFRLSYIARGAVQQADAGGLLEWQALPSEHRYVIASSRIVIEGASLDREPSLRTRRVGTARAARTDRGWAVEAHDIGSNGWVALAAPTTLATGVVPKWQEREREQRALAPKMIQFGVIALVIGVSIVLLVWRQYPPGPVVDERPAEDAPPANRPPAIAGAILAAGHSTNAHAPGTLFDLAARNALTVAETEGRWKLGHRFTMTRSAGAALAPHEAALLDVMFKNEQTVAFSTAASRIARGGRSFRRAVNEELRRLGLTDDQRRTARRRLFVVGLSLAFLSLAAAALVIRADAGAWGLAIPLAIGVTAVLALVLAATRAELSDEGLRERERWRAFRRALKASMGSSGSEALALRYLPYMAAMGLGVPFSRYLKEHGADGALPPWFRSMAGNNASAAFAAFVGAAAASTRGSGASSAGTAGGGSSGAG